MERFINTNYFPESKRNVQFCGKWRLLFDCCIPIPIPIPIPKYLTQLNAQANSIQVERIQREPKRINKIMKRYYKEHFGKYV